MNSKPFHVSASPGCHVNLFLGPFRSSLPNRTKTGIGRWAPLSPSLCLGLGLHWAFFLNALLNQDLRTSIFPDCSMYAQICSCYHSVSPYCIQYGWYCQNPCCGRNVTTYRKRKLVRCPLVICIWCVYLYYCKLGKSMRNKCINIMVPAVI